MGLAYLVYDKLVESRILLIAYLLTLLGSLGVYHVLQGKRWFGKHLTYRGAAATPRAGVFLWLAGGGEPGGGARGGGRFGGGKIPGFWVWGSFPHGDGAA